MWVGGCGHCLRWKMRSRFESSLLLTASSSHRESRKEKSPSILYRKGRRGTDGNVLSMSVKACPSSCVVAAAVSFNFLKSQKLKEENSDSVVVWQYSVLGFSS